jgi:5'(3')-deoxyribonucleotidase
MFSAAHNINYNHHQRMNNWEEILAYFKSLRKV